MQFGPHEEFRLSGRTDPVRFPIASIGTVLGCAAIGGLYGILQAHNPAVKLSLIVAVVASAAMGLLVARLCVAGHVRSEGAARALALAGAVIGLYFAWGTWLFEQIHMRKSSEFTLAHFLSRPDAVWTLARSLYEHAPCTIDRYTFTWTFRDWDLDGRSRAPFWVAEALILFVGPVVLAPRRLRAELFCEPCGTWVPRGEALAELGVSNELTLRRNLLAGDFSYLERVGLGRGGAVVSTRLELRSCPTCDATRALTAKIVSVAPARTEIIVLHDLLVSPEEVRWIQDLVPRLRAALRDEGEAKKAARSAQAEPPAAPGT